MPRNIFFWTYSEVKLKIKDWSHCMKQSIIVRPEMHCVGNCVVIRYCYKAICNGEMELFREKCLLSKSILLLLFNIWTILLLFTVCHLTLESWSGASKSHSFWPSNAFSCYFWKTFRLFFNPFQTVSIYTFLRPRYM